MADIIEKEKQVTLVNTSQQHYRTGGGEFGPKGKVKVGETEAKKLLRYPGIVDAASYKEPEDIAESDDLRKQVEDLTAENAQLRKDLAEARGGKGGEGDEGTDGKGTGTRIHGKGHGK